MPHFNHLPIMPKEPRNSMVGHSASTAPYSASAASAQRNAAIWSSIDDGILLQARASGLNWQPIASRHFPNKTANACRKRHERLIERRHVEDWGTDKLELLASEYMACRKEMWEVLAARLGERWAVVEAKCMEKGLKTLQSAARTASRKAVAGGQMMAMEDRGGISDHNSDSGIGIGSETEMEVAEVTRPTRISPSSWHARSSPQHAYPDHIRSRSLPQMLPLYQPPPPIIRTFEGAPMTTSPRDLSFQASSQSSRRCSPDSQHGRGGISIQSVLSN